VNLSTLEEFDRSIAKKRARLEKELALVSQLPTRGKVVTWTGASGWDSKGEDLPAVAKSVELVPWIVHSRNGHTGAEQMAFKVPNGSTDDLHSEHVSSKYLPEFGRRYIRALLDACEPHLQPIRAVKGRYAAMLPASCNWKAKRGYEEASVVAEGLFQVSVYAGRGIGSQSLSFYIATPEPIEVSIELPAGRVAHELFPVASYRTQYQGEDAVIERWHDPDAAAVGAAHRFCYSGDGNSPGRSRRINWLFSDRETIESLFKLNDEKLP
jgi:hypothetical protein